MSISDQAGTIPRRARLDLLTPAEKAIVSAQYAVEGAGGSPRLTDAAMLLSQARDAVADHVEGIGRATAALSFGAALQALKSGERVARAGWNGNATKTGFVPSSRSPVIFGGLGYVLLATGDVAIFDPEDFDVVSSQSNWTLMGNGYPSFTRYFEGDEGRDRETVRLHDLILPGHAMVDHENGDRLDNRRRNLRPCSPSQNTANRVSLPGSSSRYKGVTWDRSRGKWLAAIAGSGTSRTIGRFDSEDSAARAYDAAARQMHGDFARLNFPAPRMWLRLVATHEWKYGCSDPSALLPWIGMKTADEKFVPWLASQSDILADDWMIVAAGA